MKKNVLRFLAFLLLILVPFGVNWVYSILTALPQTVTLATGPIDGRYRELMERFASRLEKKLGLKVELRHTAGSVENLSLLKKGDVDFCLYQPGAVSRRQAKKGESRNVAFVANAYSEIVHFIIRKDSGIRSATDLKGKRVSLGEKHTGDYFVSLILLNHLGFTEEDIEPRYQNYEKIAEDFRNGTLDAAFLTTGFQAPVYRKIFHNDNCLLLEIPLADALCLRQLTLTHITIPSGIFRGKEKSYPSKPIVSVASHAQFLTRSDLSSALVEHITAEFMNETFLRENRLGELFQQGASFARSKPIFPIHPGALHYYEPGLKPVVNSDFVESWAGIREFIASLLIATYFGLRWFRKRRERHQEHKLDQYFKKVLNIEQKQLVLDDEGNFQDIEVLQKLLDEITSLRQQALGDFTANELNEDRAIDSFLEMCHSVSDKLNAKLSRLRFEKAIESLRITISAGD